MRLVRLIILSLLVNICVAPAVPAVAGPTDTRGLIELALDEPAHVVLENIKLGDAIDKLSEQTGVRIFMPPDVMELAPYGAATLVQRIEIENISLRQGLAELLAPLGMTFYVADDYIAVAPVEALRCLGRAPTWEELDTLAELAVMQPGVRDEDLQRLRTRVQFRVSVPDAWKALSQAVRGVGAGPGDEVLTAACAKLGWGWCFSGRQIVVASAVNQIRRILQRPISLRMNFKPLIEVLQEVGRETGVPVHAAPGALTSLPLNVQKSFSLNVRNKPAEEVLEALAAHTGLGYLIEPEGVLFFRITDDVEPPPSASSKASAGPSTSDPYVAKIVVPAGDGKSVEWLIRRSELPPDLRDKREEDLQKAFDAIRSQAADKQP